MALARHGRGPVAAVHALASQVHPVFMLPAVATSLVGGLLAPSFALPLAAVHATAIFAALYTAHVKDGLVDFHWRAEDDDHPLTVLGCRVGLVLAGALFWTCVALLFELVDVRAALLTIPCWLIAYLHAPQLDTNPVTATLGYPTGITFSLLGGYYVQMGALSTLVASLAALLFVLIAGIKTIDDSTDYEYDRSIDKHTAAVVLGPRGAHTLGFGLMAAAMAGAVGLAVFVPAVPPSAGLAAVVFAPVAMIARRAEPEIATMLLIRGSYLFLATLLAGLWLRPLG